MISLLKPLKLSFLVSILFSNSLFANQPYISKIGTIKTIYPVQVEIYYGELIAKIVFTIKGRDDIFLCEGIKCLHLIKNDKINFNYYMPKGSGNYFNIVTTFTRMR
jgi:hypothetical protein